MLYCFQGLVLKYILYILVFKTIGLSDYCHEGEFLWKSDESSLEYTNWRHNEPNDYQDNEDCVQLDSSTKWNDLRCLSEIIANGNVMTAICQK